MPCEKRDDCSTRRTAPITRLADGSTWRRGSVGITSIVLMFAESLRSDQSIAATCGRTQDYHDTLDDKAEKASTAQDRTWSVS
jgi:hypothetical protein